MFRKDDPREHPRSAEPPLRPWGEPQPGEPRPPLRPATGHNTRLLSIAFFILMLALVGAHAYRGLSDPDAWDYWKDLYISPSLTSSIARDGDHRILAIRGVIGPAAADWFRNRLDSAELTAGDTVVLSSRGGDLDQAIIIGSIVRSRELTTAVGRLDADGAMQPSYCASACVFIYAGGTVRKAVPGTRLGVHRGTIVGTGIDLAIETQRTEGLILRYMTRMGVSPALVEAMLATDEIRWLSIDEAMAMQLVTVAGQ